MKHVNVLIVLMMALAFPLMAQGAGPMETLKVPVDEVISILNDPAFSNQSNNPDQKKAQRDKIFTVTQEIFDYSLISKSTLGRFHWQNTFSPEEQKTFIDVFSKFLGNNYIDKIQQGYENEKVTFISEELLDPAKALVKTTIVQNKIEIPVDYYMCAVNDQWKVYDVNIEGVSLVQNYRSQFKSILLNQTAAQLIEQLKSKLN